MQFSASVRRILASGFLLPGSLVLSLAGCTADPETREMAWERIDLWVEEPRIEMNRNPPRLGSPTGKRISYQGAGQTWDRQRISPVPTGLRRLFSSAVRAREQLARSRLAWELELGEQPYLAFVPLSAPAGCRYRVGIRDAQRHLEELYRYHSPGPSGQVPATAQVDLLPHAGSRVELLLQIDPPPAWRPGDSPAVALWGSPAVYSRKPLVKSARSILRPNVLLLGIDTLRASALGAYGRSPSVTPVLDGLAQESDVWLEAFSCFNTTNPSFASLMTGLYGKNHAIYDLNTPLPEAHTTLAELFSAAGYETAAITSVRHLAPDRSGLGQGFDSVTAADRHFAAELVVDMAIDWLARDRQRPFFLWLHLFDPHTPHTPPEPYAHGFRPSLPTGLEPVTAWTAFRNPSAISMPREPELGGDIDLYTGEVAYVDHQLGRLLGFLRSRSLLEDTLVAFIADHGENLEEHGIRYRHTGLWDTTTHIPLMIRWPGAGREGRRIQGLVQNIDLFPTLLRAAGIEESRHDGVDLRTLTGAGRPGRRRVFSEHAENQGLMVRSRDCKLMLSRNNPFITDGSYFYDLRKDPEEEHNLTGQDSPAEQELAATAKDWAAEVRGDRPELQLRPLDPEEVERLRALGYLQ